MDDKVLGITSLPSRLHEWKIGRALPSHFAKKFKDDGVRKYFRFGQVAHLGDLGNYFPILEPDNIIPQTLSFRIQS